MNLIKSNRNLKTQQSIKIKVMLYTLKVHVEHGHIENIWSGDDITDAQLYEAKAIEYWGRRDVWICDNVQEVMVG